MNKKVNKFGIKDVFVVKINFLNSKEYLDIFK